MDTAFRTPPHSTTTDGAQRTVGVEVEFANLDAPSAAAVVGNAWDGRKEVRLTESRPDADTYAIHGALLHKQACNPRDLFEGEQLLTL